MNALHSHDQNASSDFAAVAVAARDNVVPVVLLARQPRRERDFGVGYGKSSGYAGPRPYVTNNGPRLFRCA